MSEKLPGVLQQRLAQMPANATLDAVVQVAVPESATSLKAARRISEYREAVEASLRPVALLVRDLGGDVLGEAWINGTLHVKLPVRSVGPLTDAPAVRRVEVPMPLEPESAS